MNINNINKLYNINNINNIIKLYKVNSIYNIYTVNKIYKLLKQIEKIPIIRGFLIFYHNIKYITYIV